VTLIALDDGEKLAGLEKVVETEDEQDVEHGTEQAGAAAPDGEDAPEQTQE
jgi:DNA gyrase subunit A